MYLMCTCDTHISIHALREEGDKYWCMESMPIWEFQSTPSARRATTAADQNNHRRADFNPRPPRGGRPFTMDSPPFLFLFQSTPSARRATQPADRQVGLIEISIHALREEGDAAVTRSIRDDHQFQSTPSARRATFPGLLVPSFFHNFNPRPPRGGRHALVSCHTIPPNISIHALREEGDQDGI